MSMLGNFLMIFFSKTTFLKNSFRNTIRVSNSLDPDQARHYVGPDLGPNCKDYQMRKVRVGRQRVDE